VTKLLRFLPDSDSAKSQLAYAGIVLAGGLGMRTAGKPANSPDLAAVLSSERGARGPWCKKVWMEADRPDRQDHPPQTVLRRGNFVRESSASRSEGADPIVRESTPTESASLRFRASGIGR